MKRRFGFLRKWWFWLIVILLTAFIVTYNVANLRLNDELFPYYVANNGHKPSFERYTVNDRTMRYVSIGDTTKPLVLAIHGAPSSASGWLNLLNDSAVVNNAHVVAIDRPGYGFSNFGELELSLKKQAELIAPLLEKNRKRFKTILVVGSSYGGPVAARLSMDYPNLMDGLCLVSASVAPSEEKIYDISYPTTHPLLRWVVPQALDNASTEKLGHREELLRMIPFWKNIAAVTTIIHGEKDDLIYPENAHFAERKLINAALVKKIMLPDEEHGIPFTNPKLFGRLVLEALKRTEQHQGGLLQRTKN
jgi:pimeloyl-ACP methyl ester carboxylesterase